MTKTLVVALAAVCGLAGCGLPRDPADTTHRVTGRTLRVGVVANPPWIDRTGDAVSGPEADLARALAARMQATPVWTFGPEARLVTALRRRELDVLVGGFTAKDPWADQVAVTRPFAEAGGARHVVFAPPGENRWLLTLDRLIDARRRAVGAR